MVFLHYSALFGSGHTWTCLYHRVSHTWWEDLSEGWELDPDFVWQKCLSHYVPNKGLRKTRPLCFELSTPDSLLANPPQHQAFRTHCCVQLLPAEPGHPTTK